MTSNYTPGPWRIPAGSSPLEIVGVGRIVANAAPAVNGHANARLISTAPDGHNLAEHITAMADDAYLVGHPEWQEIVDEARALIAKVEGVGVK